jgi:hypothetical protein
MQGLQLGDMAAIQLADASWMNFIQPMWEFQISVIEIN